MKFLEIFKTNFKVVVSEVIKDILNIIENFIRRSMKQLNLIIL